MIIKITCSKNFYTLRVCVISEFIYSQLTKTANKNKYVYKAIYQYIGVLYTTR